MAEIVAVYSLTAIEDPSGFKQTLASLTKKHNILGALTVACEGMNGTISSDHDNMHNFLEELKGLSMLGDLEIKFSYAESNPFVRMRLLLRPEIVTMGFPGLEPGKGTYVDAKDWNAIISDPEVLVLDTRNDYEVDIGTFHRAINPNTTSFKEFPSFVEANCDPAKHKAIAMFCTGGIRCEKASSYMLAQGYEKVYHLKGGILRYFEEVPEEESLWEGECYVFDQRVAVRHGMQQGSYTQCRNCRHPLNITKGETSPVEGFEEGVTCKYCINTSSEARKQACRERNLQMVLAKKEHRAHLGTKIEG